MVWKHIFRVSVYRLSAVLRNELIVDPASKMRGNPECLVGSKSKLMSCSTDKSLNQVLQCYCYIIRVFSLSPKVVLLYLWPYMIMKLELQMTFHLRKVNGSR